MGTGDLTGSLGRSADAASIVAGYLSRLDAALACAIEAGVARGDPARAAALSAVAVSTRFAATAAWLSTLGCVAADLLLLTTATGQLISGSATITGWVASAAVLSCVRLAAAAIATYERIELVWPGGDSGGGGR